MIKKAFLVILFICSFSLNFSFAGSEGLSYKEFLELYFGVLTSNSSEPSQKELLTYPNLKPSDPLYQILQKAVANKQFLNLSSELPFERSAFESDLALLIKYNFNIDISYQTGKVLSFEKLKSELQNIFLQLKNEKNEKAESQIPLDASTKEFVASEVFSLLKKKLIGKEKLEHLTQPRYDELSTFVEKLKVPYTKYYTPEEGKVFMGTLNSSFAGIGIYIAQEGQARPKIIKVIEKSPAEKAGLKAGDEFLSVNGKSFSSYSSFDDFSSALKGKPGSVVSVYIKRGDQSLAFDIKREEIQMPVISSEKKGGLCYFRLYSFDIGSQKKFEKAMNTLTGCTITVFDIRGNPGGVVDEVIGILDSFIPIGEPLLTVASLDKKDILFSKNQPQFFPKSPIVMLIDQDTASAAEIFAGVMKFYFPKMVTLVGTKTHGKGSVQELVEFPEDSLLKYTIALWYIATQETSIDHKGINPDRVLVDDPLTLEDEVLSVLGIDG